MQGGQPVESLRISVRGIVQGVGFRPFIYNLATGMGLKGFVTNNTGGVEIAVEGGDLGVFVDRLRAEAPPLAKILSVDIAFAVPAGFPDFEIRESGDTGRFTLISPDISVCDDCRRELFDSSNRRYLYPFINCTNCGPRYSITRSVPYDRPNTTMQAFSMCGDCSREYGDPGDRRFHAQPNACPSCGPRVFLADAGGREIGSADPLADAILMLKQGKVLAIKGLGGFHLACDAGNPDAVSGLRARKRRSNKPFALMSPDIGSIRQFAAISTEEEALLESGSRPIVLLKKRADCRLPEAVSPGNSYLGFMLPYTPLHYLLFGSPNPSPRPYPTGGRYEGEECRFSHFDALVMTSGNITEEPLVIDNDEAVSKLRGLADAFLLHDREICARVDDSVLRVRRQRGRSVTSFVRRSRGYVPAPVVLGDDGPDVMGCGADLKNTFTLTRGGYAIISQHIGDMENYETLRFYEETLKNLRTVYRAEPIALAHDLHPGYLSTRWALEQPLRLFGIQHHYAHIGSVMAEHGLASGGKVLGISFDGTGYGEDGNLWGGEFLIADTAGYKRVGHISYSPLPGGEKAIKQPWRTAAAMINRAAGEDTWDYLRRTGFAERYGERDLDMMLRISENRTFSPLSSGAGRVFDAVAALTGICDENTFEGEAGIALESLVIAGIDQAYPVDLILHETLEIDFSMTILSVISDLERQVDKRVIATKFHNTVASAVLNVAVKLSSIFNIGRVALSGGVFQNGYLLDRVIEGLSAERLTVYANEQVPCNDAGISLGQAYIIRERLKAETTG